MIACTIVSRAYVPQARVLARSFARHNPDDELWALLIDDLHHDIVDADEPFHVLRLTDLDIDQAEVHRMAMLFGNRLIAAIKPWVFEHFLARGADAVFHIDSDIVVYDSLAPLTAAAAGGVVLLPHLLHPMPRDGKDPDETKILGVGVFNAGLFGTGPMGAEFIDFLKVRLRRECVFDVPTMRVNEQRWLDFVPSLFPYHVVRDSGIDVAYWNLHERPLERRGDRIFAGGVPLRCFHFSSFDPRMRGVAGRFEIESNPRVTLGRDPLLAELCDDYRQRLIEADFEVLHRTPFGFDVLPDGTPVYDSLRSLYAEALTEAEAADNPRPPDPFDPAQVGALRAWAQEAYDRAGLPLPFRLVDAPSPPPNPTSATGDHTPPAVAAAARLRSVLRPVLGPAVRRWRQRTVPHPAPDVGSVITISATVEHTAPLTPELRGDALQTVPPAEPWVVDWLSSLHTGSAAYRHYPPERQIGLTRRRAEVMVRIKPTTAGFVVSGPRTPLDPARYRVSIELFPKPRPAGLSPNDQALVAEVFIEGYVIGHRAVTFEEVAQGPVVMDVNIPPKMLQATLLSGVELRLLSRGLLDARLGAVLVERIGAAEERSDRAPLRLDWLPVMAAGDGGRRAGVEVNTLPGVPGTVVFGPYWRLPAGRYLAEVQTRMHETTVGERIDVGGSGSPMPVATLDAVCGDQVLAHTVLTWRDLAEGQITLSFDVEHDHAGPEARIGLKLMSLAPFEAVVEGITVEQVTRFPA